MDNKYNYTYERTANYCYKDSDVLINKLNIKVEKELYIQERALVSLRTYELNENPLKGSFDFAYLKLIHKYLFQDVYSWAGEPRNCNIAKTDLFCIFEHINSYSNEIFTRLKNDNYLLKYSNGEKLDNLVELFADINALHPFREGNGRAQRVF